MIAIVDYGLGNTRAFSNLYKRLDIVHCIASTPNQLSRADKIILPGVGAFDYAVTMLNRSGLRPVLDDLIIRKKIPVLGICVGMQMLAETSDEGKLAGLGWVPGRVVEFPDSVQPLPHMGWNCVEVQQKDPLTAGLNGDSRFYFLHSFYFQCDEEYSLATTDYGINFTCVVRKENVYGVQFHPEKSHGAGITVLKNFARI